MTRTIEFNTHRKYTAAGQIIRATLHDDGIVTFFDHSRHIDGEFEMGQISKFGEALVMRHYDNGAYTSTLRSSRDGMMSGGCNTAAAPLTDDCLAHASRINTGV